jgi:hypothetical protein
MALLFRPVQQPFEDHLGFVNGLGRSFLAVFRDLKKRIRLVELGYISGEDIDQLLVRPKEGDHLLAILDIFVDRDVMLLVHVIAASTEILPIIWASGDAIHDTLMSSTIVA